jgi:hypothetical protein
MYLLITRCFFFHKLTHVQVTIEITCIPLLDIGLLNDHMLIMSVMTIVVVINVRASQKYQYLSLN